MHSNKLAEFLSKPRPGKTAHRYDLQQTSPGCADVAHHLANIKAHAHQQASRTAGMTQQTSPGFTDVKHQVVLMLHTEWPTLKPMHSSKLAGLHTGITYSKHHQVVLMLHINWPTSKPVHSSSWQDCIQALHSMPHNRYQQPKLMLNTKKACLIHIKNTTSTVVNQPICMLAPAF